MLDKIILINKYEAHIIYQDGRVVTLSSDVNVLDIIEIVIAPINVVNDIQFVDTSLDNTQSIEVKYAS